MIPVPSNVRVWLATGHTALRRLNGLALNVQEALTLISTMGSSSSSADVVVTS